MKKTVITLQSKNGWHVTASADLTVGFSLCQLLTGEVFEKNFIACFILVVKVSAGVWRFPHTCSPLVSSVRVSLCVLLHLDCHRFVDFTVAF